MCVLCKAFAAVFVLFCFAFESAFECSASIATSALPAWV